MYMDKCNKNHGLSKAWLGILLQWSGLEWTKLFL